jgi:flagellar hook-associated protein 1 FlgK
MDEEMTNMMKYKYAYDASARTLNVIDSMMEQVVNRLGIVGR